MRAFCLSVHADYKCAHSGACCTAPWPIHIELHRARELRARAMPAPDAMAGASGSIAENRTVPKRTDGSCVFFESAAGRLCSIQRQAGEALMPSACRNFPRIALHDGRGLFVTLSHFCPTAARLLLKAREIRIVDAPLSLSLDGDVEGRDATAVMPPLLAPGMLTDLEGYTTWERESIAVLDDATLSARRGVAVIAAATRSAAGWRPGGESLSARMVRAFEAARVDERMNGPVRCGRFDHAARAFLAAHLFGSWAPYDGAGLSAAVAALHSALALLGEDHADEEAFIAAARDADLWLRHAGEHVDARPLSSLRPH